MAKEPTALFDLKICRGTECREEVPVGTMYCLDHAEAAFEGKGILAIEDARREDIRLAVSDRIKQIETMDGLLDFAATILVRMATPPARDENDQEVYDPDTAIFANLDYVDALFRGIRTVMVLIEKASMDRKMAALDYMLKKKTGFSVDQMIKMNEDRQMQAAVARIGVVLPDGSER